MIQTYKGSLQPICIVKEKLNFFHEKKDFIFLYREKQERMQMPLTNNEEMIEYICNMPRIAYIYFSSNGSIHDAAPAMPCTASRFVGEQHYFPTCKDFHTFSPAGC